MRPAYSIRDGHLVFDGPIVPENTVIHGDWHRRHRGSAHKSDVLHKTRLP